MVKLTLIGTHPLQLVCSKAESCSMQHVTHYIATGLRIMCVCIAASVVIDSSITHAFVAEIWSHYLSLFRLVTLTNTSVEAEMSRGVIVN